ncbi:antA/AntB antirepressor family protein [Streptococcus suis]
MHEALGVRTAYKDWFPRMVEYGFVGNQDFNPLNFEQVCQEGSREVKRIIQDHVIAGTPKVERCLDERTYHSRIKRQSRACG